MIYDIWAPHLSIQQHLSTNCKQFCPNCMWPLGEAGIYRLRRTRGGVSISTAMGEPLSMLGADLPARLFWSRPSAFHNPQPTLLCRKPNKVPQSELWLNPIYCWDCRRTALFTPSVRHFSNVTTLFETPPPGDVAQLVKYLSSMHKLLALIASTL